MNKEIYERTALEIILFSSEDVIMNSSENPDDDYELEKTFIRLP